MQPRQPSCKRYFSSQKGNMGSVSELTFPSFLKSKEELLSVLQISVTLTLQKGHVSIHDL